MNEYKGKKSDRNDTHADHAASSKQVELNELVAVTVLVNFDLRNE